MAIRNLFRRLSGPRVRLSFHLALSGVVIVISWMVFIHPAITIGVLATDSRLRTTGESRLVTRWFRSATPRFLSWASRYLETHFAQAVRSDDIPATEWPMFGAVFYLLTAEELQGRGEIDATQGTIRAAVERAGQIVASPVTASWVKAKWGERYLEQENVFYRMLLILGLSSYERITGDPQHREIMSSQRTSLAVELAAAKLHLRDDYPDECYPADMLWAVAAIERAARLEHASHAELAHSLMAAFDGPLRAKEGLPAFQAESRSGRALQGARGCGNSGILLFAAELEADTAGRWYSAYEAGFWKDTGWIAGFTEMPRGTSPAFMDVDSGPVLCEVGSVASAFGIGAAKSVGRFDHAAPLTMQVVACAWPTPMGFLVPGLMGYLATDSWSLGEVALLFSMTRPTRTAATVPFCGRVPWIVWLLLVGYFAAGSGSIGFEVRCCRRRLRQYRADKS